MRKSERLRLLELRVDRLEMLVELYTQSLINLLESQGLEDSAYLESGKWYNTKSESTDTE